MSSPHGTGHCPHCHRPIWLTFRGKLKDHSVANFGPCDGSGKPPVPGTVQKRDAS